MCGMKTQIICTLLAGTLVSFSAATASVPEATVANLNAALHGEANASHRYELFAKKAEEEGYKQVALLFRAASKAEAIHRDTHREAILSLGGKVQEPVLDEVKVGTTRENLQAAIKGESYERDTMYPSFIKQAKQDGAKAAVRSFDFAVTAEGEHAKLYQDALANLGNNAPADYFVCTVCGYTVTQLPGKNCPSCHSPRDKYIKISPSTA
jgi:rubrerythrin